MRKHVATSIATYTLLCLAGGTSLLMPETLSVPESYAEGRQRAIFLIQGSAADGTTRFGDAILEAVEYPSGQRFDSFVMAASVSDFFFSGPPGAMRAVTGLDSRVGTPGVFPLETGDGDDTSISATDMHRFKDRLLTLHRDRNLNSHLEIKGDHPFSYVIEFEQTVLDNEEQFDDFGELLCFERGAEAGDSWFMLEALDEGGHRVGRPLVISPLDMHGTVPPTRLGIYSDSGLPTAGSEEMGATAVDLTRLGVKSVRFLRVSTPVPGQHGYGGGDVGADLKVLAVTTRARRPNPELAKD